MLLGDTDCTLQWTTIIIDILYVGIGTHDALNRPNIKNNLENSLNGVL